MSSRALAIASWAYAAGVAVFAGFAVWLAATEHLSDLWADDWLILLDRGEHSLVRWLFTSHNGHLIPLTRLLLLADLEWLSGHGTLPIAVAVVAIAAAAALLWLPVRASGIEPASTRRAVGAFLAFCLIYGGILYGLLWGFAAHAPLMSAWLALSVSALIAWAVDDAPRRRWLLPLAFGGATGASLACAAGLGAWAALLAIAVVARRPRGVLAAIAVAGAACCALVAFAPLPVREPAELLPPLSPFLRLPLVVVGFLFRYLGTPFAWLAQSWLGASEAARNDVAFAAGGIGVAFFVAYLARRIGAGRCAEPACLLAVGLMASGFVAAALTAIARGGAFPVLDYRFTPFALPLWMGAAVAIAAPGSLPARGAVRRALPLLLPIASLLMLRTLGPSLDHHREQRAEIARYGLMVGVGIRGKAVVEALAASHRHKKVIERMKELGARGVGPFADPRLALLGAPVSAAGIEGEPPACAGSILERKRLTGARGQGERIDGVLDAEPGAPRPTSIVVADGRGVIRGLGNVAAAGPSPAEWYAFRAYPRHGSARLYGVFADESVCTFAQR